MKDGAVEQVDTPDKIVLNPATEYVARFTEAVERAVVDDTGQCVGTLKRAAALDVLLGEPV